MIENAEKQKLDIISITDHNSVSAYFELEENPEIRKIYSGEIIIGSEIKAIFDDINIEILAYGIDYKKINIKKEDKLQVQTDILKHYINVAKNLGIKVDEDIKIDTKDPTKIFACWVFYDNITKYKENEKILKTTPIDGLECIYPLFNKKDTDFMINLCQKYQKLMSGGSDYHAKNKPTISMGTGIDNNISIQKTFVKDWVNKVRKI
ncbi:MAG: hypothetical protein HFI86_06035 [Bacilli bacterium]|nr:hypothetical protein [Bacilli bacterium]